MSETRQRWRLVVQRGSEARDLVHRDVIAAWEGALRASDLPLAMSEGASPRPRISFAAPVPVGMRADRELIDVGLAERRRVDEARAAVESALPPGYRLVDLYDVWPGAPPLPGSVVAADYRVTTTVTEGSPTTGLALGVACAAVMDSASLERLRDKGGGPVTVDVRPLLVDLRAADPAADGNAELWMRLRLGGEGGVGRPEEIVSILGERVGRRLEIREVVRERILLADELT